MHDIPKGSIDQEVRLRHAAGHSFSDWVGKKAGVISSIPDGVAFPESHDDVMNIMAYAKHHGCKVIPYGGGTSVAGHINPADGDEPVLTVSLAKMNRLLSFDPEDQLATFQAGATGLDIERQLAEYDRVLGHYPQSFEYSTLGGWIATRSSGQQSLGYGRIEDLFAGGKLVTPEGELNLMSHPASAAGPDFKEWILGSEGRFGIITEADVRVSNTPVTETFKAWFLPNWTQSVEAVRALARDHVGVSMVRLSNAKETAIQLILAGHPLATQLLDRWLDWLGAADGKCMLLVGFTGTADQVEYAQRMVRRLLKPHKAVSTGTFLGKRWQNSRFKSPYMREALWQAGYGVDTLETAVNWSRVTSTMQGIEEALKNSFERFSSRVLTFSHLSHLYPQGSSVYTTYIFPRARTPEATTYQWKAAKQAASEAIVAHGGTISHHHGVGVDHAPYLWAEKGSVGIRALRELMRAFDPTGMMNPGKLVP